MSVVLSGLFVHVAACYALLTQRKWVETLDPIFVTTL